MTDCGNLGRVVHLLPCGDVIACAARCLSGSVARDAKLGCHGAGGCVDAHRSAVDGVERVPEDCGLSLGLSKRSDDVANTLCDLASDSEDGTGGSGHAREGEDGALRAGIHVCERLASVRYAVDDGRHIICNVKQRLGERPTKLDS